jgi:arsenite/tail-anchored protein-transporting ATPase
LGRHTSTTSLDFAQSISDIFDLKKDFMDQNRGKPIKVYQSFRKQELDIKEQIERKWGKIYRYLSPLLNATGLDEILVEELAILPGMGEVSLLLHINHYMRR